MVWSNTPPKATSVLTPRQKNRQEHAALHVEQATKNLSPNPQPVALPAVPVRNKSAWTTSHFNGISPTVATRDVSTATFSPKGILISWKSLWRERELSWINAWKCAGNSDASPTST